METLASLNEVQLARCQAALALLRQEVTLAADDVSSKAAKACRRTYPYALAAFNQLHDWGNAESPETLSGLAEAAFVAYLAREMAIPVTGRLEDLKAVDAMYAARLREAVVHALETEPLEGAVERETAALLRPMQDMAATALPRSLKARIAELLPAARAEVMGAHRWNFARVCMPCCPRMEPNGDSLVARPGDCVRVEAVHAADGRLAEWSMRGPFIVARAPIALVTYIRDVDDADGWPAAVRRVLACRIAADIAGPGAQRFEAMYREKLSAAAVLDAREGNPGRAAWGRRRFAEAFR